MLQLDCLWLVPGQSLSLASAHAEGRLLTLRAPSPLSHREGTAYLLQISLELFYWTKIHFMKLEEILAVVTRIIHSKMQLSFLK